MASTLGLNDLKIATYCAYVVAQINQYTGVEHKDKRDKAIKLALNHIIDIYQAAEEEPEPPPPS